MHFTISPRFKRALIEALLISILASFSAIFFNTFSDNRLPLVAQPRELKHAADTMMSSDADSQQISGDSFNEPLVISIDQAYKLFLSKKVLFIDARNADLFAMGHIEGAMNVPWHGPEAKVQLPDTLSRSRRIITYCEGPECDSAVELAYFLFDIEFYRVQIFREGWAAWERKNYPSKQAN
ncbi:rhodanese-like domain-containing protein [candidate division KSB1 bacterium]|nr:rhodanese-like domain-containing protein [candidate division KSB1 bacterium]